MPFTFLGSRSRLFAVVPSLSRSHFIIAPHQPVSSPRGGINTPTEFLKAIGRSSDTKLKLEHWHELWSLSGPSMKRLGVGVRDRRYILWCIEKYRTEHPIRTFAHEQQPKKKIRGWGPSVQNGKLIRSRRPEHMLRPSTSKKRRREEKDKKRQLLKPLRELRAEMFRRTHKA